MKRSNIRAGVDKSLAVKAHEHALAAVQLAKEGKYKEAAEMHEAAGKYFKQLQALLKEENETETALALGLLVHHHAFMQNDMIQRDKIQTQPSPTQANNKTQSKKSSSSKHKSTKLQYNSTIEKAGQEVGEKAGTKQGNTPGKQNEPRSKYAGERNDTKGASRGFPKELVDEVTQNFEDVLSIQNKIDRDLSKRYPTMTVKSKGMEESFFIVNEKSPKHTHSKRQSTRHVAEEQLQRLSKDIKAIDAFKLEYQAKFKKLKSSLEEFKRVCGLSFESKVRALHSSNYSLELQKNEKEITDLKFQLEKEKARRYKAQQELDRYARHIAKNKRVN